MCCGLFSLAQLWQCYHLGLLFEAGPGLKRTRSRPPAHHKRCMCNRRVQSASVSVSLWDLLLWLLFNYQSGTPNIFWLTTCVYALQLDHLIINIHPQETVAKVHQDILFKIFIVSIALFVKGKKKNHQFKSSFKVKWVSCGIFTRWDNDLELHLNTDRSQRYNSEWRN